jgi:hypothetical protein
MHQTMDRCEAQQKGIHRFWSLLPNHIDETVAPIRE